MNNFKPCGLVAPNRSGVPHVPRLPLQTEILEHNVCRFEHLDRERVRPVLPNSLEQARDKRGSDDLEFQGLRVSDFHYGFPIVDFVQPLEVFFV